MALQAILIADPLYEQARRTVDFIKAYIFPGGCLPSLGAIARSLASACDLRLIHFEDITSHYARTLAPLARALRPEPRGDLGARLLRGVPAHVGVLSLLLRSGLQRAPPDRLGAARAGTPRRAARPILGAL